MNHDSDYESESSLPTQPVHLPSSPPIIKQRETLFEKLEEMDSQSRQSEPPPTQNDAARPPPRRVSSEETERPPSAQQVQKDADEHTEFEDGEDEENIDFDPAEKIADFDWDDLHGRYHQAMERCHAQEGELAQEWESLMNYFRIWAESGHDHETDRTFQRLKTRTTYVQSSEATLEHKRNHYINVVKAFESALNLLKAQSYGH